MNKMKTIGLVAGLLLAMNVHANAASAAACAGMASAAAVNYSLYEETNKPAKRDPNCRPPTMTELLICVGVIVGGLVGCRIIEWWQE